MSRPVDVRIYTWEELRHRLMSPTWCLIKKGENFIFMPSAYRGHDRGRK